MEYFLVRLAYTPAAWADMVENTTHMDERLAPVRQLIRHLGGSLASFGFFDTEHSQTDAAPPHVVRDKFVMWSGHDILTVLAMPDKEAAHAFNMAVSSEPGLKVVDLTPLVPLDHAVRAMATAKAAAKQTGYAAPGRPKP